jgi:hypothetical protein
LTTKANFLGDAMLLGTNLSEEPAASIFMAEGWENAAGYFEKLLPIYQTTRLPIPEKSNLYFHHRENLKSHITYFLLGSLTCDI